MLGQQGLTRVAAHGQLTSWERTRRHSHMRSERTLTRLPAGVGGGQACEDGLEIRLLCALCPACCAGQAGRPLGIKDPGAGCCRGATGPPVCSGVSSASCRRLGFSGPFLKLVACAVVQSSDTLVFVFARKAGSGWCLLTACHSLPSQSRPRPRPQRLQVMSFPSWEAAAAQLSWLLSLPLLPRPGPSISHCPKGCGGGGAGG